MVKSDKERIYIWFAEIYRQWVKFRKKGRNPVKVESSELARLLKEEPYFHKDTKVRINGHCLRAYMLIKDESPEIVREFAEILR
ncbi:MAG: hypothetical protein M0Z31_06410 [Clostridia bacterium]|nr:hypothetical protein [Clostridia bacterium]